MRYFHAMWNPMYVHNVQCSGGVFIQVCVCSVTARGQCLLRKPLPIPMQVIHLHITLVDCPPWINSTQSNHIPMQVIHLIVPAQNSPIDFLVFIFNACALLKQVVNNQKNLVKLVNSWEFNDIWCCPTIWIASCSVQQTMDIVNGDDGRYEMRKRIPSGQWALKQFRTKNCKESF